MGAPAGAAWAHAALVPAALMLACAAVAETVGSVDTAFKLIGPDHKVVVEVFDDPMVDGVSCYLSRVKTGGINLDSSVDRSWASVTLMKPLMFPNLIDTPVGLPRTRRDCRFFCLPGVVAPPGKMASASSSRLARRPEKCTLAPVQLRNLGLKVLSASPRTRPIHPSRIARWGRSGSRANLHVRKKCSPSAPACSSNMCGWCVWLM